MSPFRTTLALLRRGILILQLLAFSYSACPTLSTSVAGRWTTTDSAGGVPAEGWTMMDSACDVPVGGGRPRRTQSVGLLVGRQTTTVPAGGWTTTESVVGLLLE